MPSPLSPSLTETPAAVAEKSGEGGVDGVQAGVVWRAQCRPVTTRHATRCVYSMCPHDRAIRNPNNARRTAAREGDATSARGLHRSIAYSKVLSL